MVICKTQIVLDGNPTSINIYTEETTNILLDGDLNSINGEACIQSFEIASNSPTQSAWITNDGLSLTFSPPDLATVGLYEIQYEVIETGVGS